MTRRNRKKSETLDIRLPYEQKRDFMQATQKQGETASKALRRFIADYIEEARLAEIPNPVQEITMTLARHRLKTLATAASAALGVFAFTALPSAADASPFDRLDKNKDGVLSTGEFLIDDDADIIEHLDSDGSGDVSREELEAAGNRIVIKKTNDDQDGDKKIVKKQVKVIEFRDGDEASIGEEIEKRVVIKRTGGEELSQEEMDALIEDALAEAGIEGEVDIRIEVDEITKDED